jgi:hypothetical protein
LQCGYLLSALGLSILENIYTESLLALESQLPKNLYLMYKKNDLFFKDIGNLSGFAKELHSIQQISCFPT